MNIYTVEEILQIMKPDYRWSKLDDIYYTFTSNL